MCGHAVLASTIALWLRQLRGEEGAGLKNNYLANQELIPGNVPGHAVGLCEVIVGHWDSRTSCSKSAVLKHVMLITYCNQCMIPLGLKHSYISIDSDPEDQPARGKKNQQRKTLLFFFFYAARTRTRNSPIITRNNLKFCFSFPPSFFPEIISRLLPKEETKPVAP